MRMFLSKASAAEEPEEDLGAELALALEPHTLTGTRTHQGCAHPCPIAGLCEANSKLRANGGEVTGHVFALEHVEDG